MALKDWTQINSFMFVNKKEDTALAMSQKGFENKFIFSVSKKQSNGHFLMGNHIGKWGTKSQALRFAKLYMRSH